MPSMLKQSEPRSEHAQEQRDGHWLDELTPRQIVAELDKYIVGQDAAKKAVAIALRNRWRRQLVEDELREEIMPNNIIMIGPTGVGKTEIARRLARLASAPFVKVEASKFTEVGYVGRDVESMIRDLVDVAINMVREEREAEVEEVAEQRVEERLLDLLLPPVPEVGRTASADTRPAAEPENAIGRAFVVGPAGEVEEVAGQPGDARILDSNLQPVPEVERTASADTRPAAEPENAIGRAFVVGPAGEVEERKLADLAAADDAERQRVQERRERTREKLRTLLRDGK